MGSSRNRQNNHHKSAINLIKNTVKEAAFPTVSRFQEWDTDSLKQLLVDNNVQIRGSANASHETLVRICDEVFGPVIEEDYDDDENDCDDSDIYYGNGEDDIEDEEGGRRQGSGKFNLPMNSSFTFEDLARMNWAAMKIQSLFIASRQRMYDRMYSQNQQNYHNQEYDFDEYQHEEYHPLEFCEDLERISDCMNGEVDNELYDDVHDESIHDEEEDMYENYEEATNCEDSIISDHRDTYKSSGSDEMSSATSPHQIDEELNAEWRKPSWKFAKRFEAENRPHKAGKDMKRYHWRKTLTGRHCTIGGCGEQFDLWDEGATSEFSQFGSGITNYFKVCFKCY